jgi:hypothetical protein
MVKASSLRRSSGRFRARVRQVFYKRPLNYQYMSVCVSADESKSDGRNVTVYVTELTLD